MSSRKRKELDPFMRTRICELRNTAQWSYGRIHKAYPDIPLSTIKSTCQSQKKRVNNQSRPRSGRPRKDKSSEGLQEHEQDQIPEQIQEDERSQQALEGNGSGFHQQASTADLRGQQEEQAVAL
ncbi:hypothetical protein N7466_007561 [Penicillium verhagenii]|uniref:uncharacterized protein n=1 Tax=Penicillium verhagenii TaxID=1562060 RepID=UPI00254570B0|nr:uncharacterized protein N7466_007561 [Penicillium verhagenii]KAJ5928605.1 hypothetical protein N7466_007561 [Penicillium verhagenii]